MTYIVSVLIRGVPLHFHNTGNESECVDETTVIDRLWLLSRCVHVHVDDTCTYLTVYFKYFVWFGVDLCVPDDKSTVTVGGGEQLPVTQPRHTGQHLHVYTCIYSTQEGWSSGSTIHIYMYMGI